MIALIDGDIIAWRTATSTDDFVEATKRADELINNIVEATNSTEYRLILSSPTNFRKEIYPEYKGQRPPTPDIVKDMKYYLESVGAEIAPNGLEADDVMAIEQSKWVISYDSQVDSRIIPAHNRYETTICTIDKDLLQVQGWHYQWELRGTSVNGKEWVKEAKFFEQTELEGNRLFYEQCLKGDKADNVKGVFGLGDTKAKKLLAKAKSELEMINICLEQYSTEEEFLMNAQCLYILRTYNDNYLKRYERVLNESDSHEV